MVVYDPQRHLAHSLNRTALAIWKHCNGHNSVTELRRLVAVELGVEIDEGTIWLALRRLDSAHLLVQAIDGFNAVSRRQLLRTAGRIGIAAAVTPLISSALVPMAAAATSVPACTPTADGDDDDLELHCSSFDESCVCSKTTSGLRICVNPSTALKRRTCRHDNDCPPTYVCIPRGIAPPRCIAPCKVPTCRC